MGILDRIKTATQKKPDNRKEKRDRYKMIAYGAIIAVFLILALAGWITQAVRGKSQTQTASAQTTQANSSAVHSSSVRSSMSPSQIASSLMAADTQDYSHVYTRSEWEDLQTDSTWYVTNASIGLFPGWQTWQLSFFNEGLTTLFSDELTVNRDITIVKMVRPNSSSYQYTLRCVSDDGQTLEKHIGVDLLPHGTGSVDKPEFLNLDTPEYSQAETAPADIPIKPQN